MSRMFEALRRAKEEKFRAETRVPEDAGDGSKERRLPVQKRLPGSSSPAEEPDSGEA